MVVGAVLGLGGWDGETVANARRLIRANRG